MANNVSPPAPTFASVLEALRHSANGDVPYNFWADVDDREDRTTAWATCPACNGRLKVTDRGGTGLVDCLDGCKASLVVDALNLGEELSPAALAGSAGIDTDDWLDGTPMDPAAVPAERLPAVAGHPFLLPGESVLISGPTGSGRSALAQACAYDGAKAGVRVGYCGSEVSEEEFNARAADLARRRGDAVDDELRAQLASVRYLDLAAVVVHAREAPERFAAQMASRFDVLVLDPLSVVASALDWDFDKSNADYVRFHDRLVQPLLRRGVSVLLLDNIGHAVEAKGRAKGASAKQDRADVVLTCKLRANPIGLTLTASKVRSVRAPFGRGDRWLFDRDTQRIAAEVKTSEADDIWRPTHLMEKVSMALEEHGPLGRNEILAQVRSNTTNVDAAIRALIHDEHVVVEDGGSGRKKVHQLRRTYRETPTETDRDPTETEPEPVSVGGTETTETTPLQGGSRFGFRSPPSGNGQPRPIPPCTCASPGERTSDGRCGRCYGEPADVPTNTTTKEQTT